MKHANNDISNGLLKIGRMLGLEKDDIFRLRKTVLNKNIANIQIATLQDPADSYKNSIGYYGTVSINDF